MPNLPEGQYTTPLGLLIIKSGRVKIRGQVVESTTIRLIPLSKVVPKQLVHIDWIFYDEEYDGWEVSWGETGISDAEVDLLPERWWAENWEEPKRLDHGHEG